MLEEKTPVDLTPLQAFNRGMVLGEYARLKHGHLRNQRVDEFRGYLARLSLTNGGDTVQGQMTRDLTVGHLVLSHAAMYHALSSYSMNPEAQIMAVAHAAAVEALGGKIHFRKKTQDD